jgi:hypothetical protein
VVVRRQLKRRYVLAFFEKLAPCLIWHRGLCVIPPLVTPASGIGTRRAADATELCEALRQTTKERCH